MFLWINASSSAILTQSYDTNNAAAFLMWYRMSMYKYKLLSTPSKAEPCYNHSPQITVDQCGQKRMQQIRGERQTYTHFHFHETKLNVFNRGALNSYHSLRIYIGSAWRTIQYYRCICNCMSLHSTTQNMT